VVDGYLLDGFGGVPLEEVTPDAIDALGALGERPATAGFSFAREVLHDLNHVPKPARVVRGIRISPKAAGRLTSQPEPVLMSP
jgi:hypothetical protein